MAHDRFATKIAAYEGIRGYGHTGLAEQLKALKQPPAPEPSEAEQESPSEPAGAERDVESLGADDLEQLIDQ